MNVKKRALARVGVLAGGVALSLVAATGGAQAYTNDGTSPASTGCANDGTTVASAPMKNSAGTHGTIELRYSLTCHTAWARLTLDYTQGACGNASAGYACAAATVTRNNDGRTYSCTITQGQTQCYTPQVYDKGMTSYAKGYIDIVSGEMQIRTTAY
ncbi:MULTISPECIES: DUF2690 domain-containing protein [Streptomyces]|uniref:DUF2690 domain-containing protein n=1 Tax=Streptomyces TaxID=1883 RepID=UPI0029B99616|nr:DUF2690 domain-containing protein [Streptomyces sp. WI03-4A]MDX2595197.1 DUF2690 domain-containing protein [Streptomyces sp. WI03-4A]